MQRQDSFDDEVARRRARRQGYRADQELADGERPLPRLGWRDTLAMIIAAYQVLFPVLLAMFAALALTYLLFRWFFV